MKLPWLHALRGIVAASGLLVVFVGFSTLGVVLHSSSPVGRAVTARYLTGFLSGYFYGSVRVGEVARLGAHGLTAKNLTVYDVYDNRVLVISELRARTNLREIFEKLLSDERKVSLVIHHVRVERGEVQIIPDPETGLPTIEHALTPLPSPGPSSTREIRVWLPRIEVGEAYGRGEVSEGAPTLEADLSTIRGSVLVTPKGTLVDVTQFSLNLRGLRGVDAKGVGSFYLRQPGSIWGYFDGHFGHVQTGVFVRYDDGQLSVRLDVPEADPEGVRAIWQPYPIKVPISLHAEATGPLVSLKTSWLVKIGGATLSANGPLSLVDDSGFELHTTGKNLDLSAIWPSVPPTSIDAEASLSLWFDQGQTNLEFNGFTEPSRVGQHVLPAVDIRGDYGERGLSSVATVHESGLPLRVSLDIDPKSNIDLKLDAKRFSLEHPRVKPYLSAKGFADGDLAARIEGDKLKGTFDANLESLAWSDVKLERGRAKGTFTGNLQRLSELEIHTKLSGQGFSRAAMSYQKVDLALDGPLQAPRVKANLSDETAGKLVASAELRTEGQVGVRDLALSVENAGAKLAISAGRIDTEGGGFKVDGLVVRDGDSELKTDIEVLPGQFRFKASGRNVDLARVQQALGLRLGPERGKLSIDADVVGNNRTQAGDIDVRFEDVDINDELKDMSGQAHLTLDDGRLVGQAEVGLEGLGKMGAAVDLALAGSIDEVETWKNATGSTRLELYAVDLGYFNRYLKKDSPIQDLGGIGSARVRIERDDNALAPTMLVDAHTRGLRFSVAPSEATAKKTLVQGIELQLGGAVNGKTGQLSGSLRALDHRGPLLSTSGAASIDTAELLEHPAQALASLQQTPLEGVLVLPSRKLEELPDPLQPSGIEGVVSGRVSVQGTLGAPELSALLDIERLTGPATALVSPVNLHSRFHYTSETRAFGGTLEIERKSDRIVWGNFSGTLPPEAASASTGLPRFVGGGTFSVEGLPLELLGPMRHAKVSGKLDGIVAVSSRGELPDVNAKLELHGGRIRSLELGTGQIAARVVGGQVSVDASFVNERSELELKARTKLEHDSALLEIGENPVLIDVRSDNYDAILLQPFVDDLFSELSGPLDANVHAELQRQGPATEAEAATYQAKFSGTAHLKSGTIRPRALGIELRNSEVRLKARKEGEHNVLEIAEFTGNAQSDKPNFRGKGKVYLKGTKLSHGWASAGLDDVPFVVSGVRLADLSGQVSASFRQDPDRVAAVVDIPKLRAVLPRSSGRSLVDLEPNPDVSLLQPLTEPDNLKESGLPWIVDVNLGDHVRLQSAAINLRLTGEPELTIGDEFHVDGKVVLPSGGRVTVAGKLFIVEHGFVQFDTEDPTDPHISIRAVWRTPTGVLVTANLRGTARQPELVLESDPPLPGGEAEIFALLFGGGAGETESNASSPALGAGATFLSEMLGNTPLRGVELRAGVEKKVTNGQSATLADEEWRSYAAAVPISDDVWFEGTYKTEQRGTATESRSGFSGTIDWRFMQDWALRTEIGELGTGMDLLWYYRY